MKQIQRFGSLRLSILVLYDLGDPAVLLCISAELLDLPRWRSSSFLSSLSFEAGWRNGNALVSGARDSGFESQACRFLWFLSQCYALSEYSQEHCTPKFTRNIPSR